MKRGSNSGRTGARGSTRGPIDGDVDIETLEEFRHCQGMPYEVYAVRQPYGVHAGHPAAACANTVCGLCCRAMPTTPVLMACRTWAAGVDVIACKWYDNGTAGTAHTLLCIPERIAFIRQWQDECAVAHKNRPFNRVKERKP